MSGCQSLLNDDMSLVAAFIGWPSLVEAAAAFATQLAALRALLTCFHHTSEEAQHLEENSRRRREAAEAALTAGWEDYRQAYMALLPEPAGRP